MPPTAPSSLATDIAAALDWWRVAGVDAVFADEAQPWLSGPELDTPAARPATVRQEVAAAPKPQIGGDMENWPQDLPAFDRWWIDEPSLDEGGLAPRVAPTGPAGAPLMVLVAMPEAGDRDALLSGPEGTLLDGFLRAANLPHDAVRVGAVLPRHTALPDWATIADHGMDKVVARHVALAAPKRLLVLGRNISPLCGHDPAQGPAASSFFNHEGGRVPVLHEVGLDRLLKNALSRARLWKRWLDWTDRTTCSDTGG